MRHFGMKLKAVGSSDGKKLVQISSMIGKDKHAGKGTNMDSP